MEVLSPLQILKVRNGQSGYSAAPRVGYEELLTHCGQVMPNGMQIWVNIGSGIALLPDSTKPLPEVIFVFITRTHIDFLSVTVKSLI